MSYLVLRCLNVRLKQITDSPVWIEEQHLSSNTFLFLLHVSSHYSRGAKRPLEVEWKDKSVRYDFFQSEFNLTREISLLIF